MGKAKAQAPAETVGGAAAEWVHISKMEPWARNPRIITEADIEEAVQSFLRFGFGTAMIGWEGNGRIVGGHARRLGVLRLVNGTVKPPARARPELYRFEVEDGLIKAGSFVFAGAPGPGYVPFRWHPFESEDEAAAYALRDNNPLGAWNDREVAAMAQDLEKRGTNLGGLGWDEDELEKLRHTADNDDDEGGSGGGGGEGGGDDVPDNRYTEQYGVIVVCENAAAQERAFEALKALGYNCKVVVT